MNPDGEPPSDSVRIAGGYSIAGTGSHGYLADDNAITGHYSNWTSFDYPNGVVGRDYITHFEGISIAEKGIYTLVADSAQVGATNVVQGSFVTVRRNTDGSFGSSSWVDLNDPNVPGIVSLTDHAHGNAIGGFQPSIEPQVTVSANRGYGLKFVGQARNNVVFDTAIGTTSNATTPLPNGLGAILVGPTAKGNKINGSPVS